MHQVRAKFRCLGITHKWNKSIIAEFGVVRNKQGDNFEENSTFWEFTPTGKAELIYYDECDLEVGAYYYVDFVSVDGKDDSWKLDSVQYHHGGQGDVEFSWWRSLSDEERKSGDPQPAGMSRGSVSMMIEGEKTPALKAFMEPGSRWSVDFTFAEASDD